MIDRNIDAVNQSLRRSDRSDPEPPEPGQRRWRLTHHGARLDYPSRSELYPVSAETVASQPLKTVDQIAEDLFL